MFLGLVLTARHGMGGGSAGSSRSNIGVHGKITDWAKVVTRYPYENVRMDYLLIERFIYFSIVLSSGGLDAWVFQNDFNNPFRENEVDFFDLIFSLLSIKCFYIVYPNIPKYDSNYRKMGE